MVPWRHCLLSSSALILIGTSSTSAKVRTISSFRTSRSILRTASSLSASTSIRTMSSSSPSSIAPFLGSKSSSVADVFMVPMFNDNYGYLLVRPGSTEALVVDPGDGQAILRACQDLGLTLTTALCTHKHGDHVGGNIFLREALPDLHIIGTQHEAIPCANQLVGEGDIISFGDLRIRTLYTPCHTAGHVVYFVDRECPSSDGRDQPLLFCGDTLFVGGCGRFFEGTAEQMLNNMDKLTTLPGETQVFCAHEYTEGNFKFLAHVDSSLAAKYHEVQRMRQVQQSTVPSTIAEELRTNLFMQCRNERVQALVGQSDPVATMHELRTLKNKF